MLNAMEKIELIVNGRKSATAARTLAELVDEHELSGVKVATALNGNFVPEARRATTGLETGDRVEIVSARQGG
ncbi:sulfur carrier protein ThiS [Hyphomicrobium sp.]|jgi:sulfur carrier protein|uniref:sulfur carrier protein ThiS n=1 Tax=Hyphomicrobium sp. TaxID=82 RepID=UPI002C698B4D|nr:sulfur carrier protein ThiS [Hyphomicrobium sp.]HVZ03376.1 sulfur carrier protein ThiS [Hyphomicrobium sp.]